MVIGRDHNVLGYNSFTRQQSIETVSFEDCSELLLIRSSAFSHCCALRSVSIPSLVQQIGDSCFECCSQLAEVVFEPGSLLTRIGPCVFQKCTSLRSICIPAQLEALPHSCFLGCTSLASVRFEADAKLTGFGLGAFEACVSLASICIPASVKYPGLGPFADCTSLRELAFELPSQVRHLALPPSDFQLMQIPDSVDIIWAVCPRLGTRNRILHFGEKSPLRGISVTALGRTAEETASELRGNGIFICYPEKMLSRFRRQEEGAWTDLDLMSVLDFKGRGRQG
jgi:hypothetical protein